MRIVRFQAQPMRALRRWMRLIVSHSVRTSDSPSRALSSDRNAVSLPLLDFKLRIKSTFPWYSSFAPFPTFSWWMQFAAILSTPRQPNVCWRIAVLLVLVMKMRFVEVRIGSMFIGMALRRLRNQWQILVPKDGLQWVAFRKWIHFICFYASFFWLIFFLCVSDGPERTLPTLVSVDGPLTIAKCTSACETAGFNLAGTQYSNECCKLFPREIWLV